MTTGNRTQSHLVQYKENSTRAQLPGGLLPCSQSLIEGPTSLSSPLSRLQNRVRSPAPLDFFPEREQVRLALTGGLDLNAKRTQSPEVALPSVTRVRSTSSSYPSVGMREGDGRVQSPDSIVGRLSDISQYGKASRSLTDLHSAAHSSHGAIVDGSRRASSAGSTAEEDATIVMHVLAEGAEETRADGMHRILADAKGKEEENSKAATPGREIKGPINSSVEAVKSRDSKLTDSSYETKSDATSIKATPLNSSLGLDGLQESLEASIASPDSKHPDHSPFTASTTPFGPAATLVARLRRKCKLKKWIRKVYTKTKKVDLTEEIYARPVLRARRSFAAFKGNFGTVVHRKAARHAPLLEDGSRKGSGCSNHVKEETYI